MRDVFGAFRGRHSVLLRYLVSFLLVLVLPLAAVSFFFYLDLNDRLEAQSMESQLSEMSRIAERLDGQLDSLLACCQRLNSSSNLLRYKLRDLPGFGLQIINELRSNCGQNDFLSNLYIYSPEQSYVYSAYTTYTIGSFVEYITGGTRGPEEYARFVSGLRGQMIPVDEGGPVCLYAPFDRGGEGAVLIFEVGRSALDRLMAQELPSSGRFLGVYSEGGRLLASAGELPAGEAPEALARSAEPPERVRTEQGEWNVLHWDSPQVGWRVLYLCDVSAPAELVRRSNGRFFLLVLAVLAAGSVLVFLLTYLSYRPIRELKATARALLSDSPPTDGEPPNELEAVRGILASLHSSVEQLSGQEGLNRRALKQYAITCTALGQARDYSTIRTSLDRLGVLEENEYYFAVLLYLSDQSVLTSWNAPAELDSYTDFLESFPAQERSICAVSGVGFNQLLMLVSTASDDMRLQFPVLSSLREQFTARFGVPATLSVGLAYPELDFISISYMQALTAYEYRAIEERDCVIAFDPDAAGLGTDIKYQNLLSILQRAMDAASAAQVEDTLHRILRLPDTEKMTVHNVKFFCFGVLKVISASLYGYKYDYFSKLSEKYDLSMVMSIETTEDFRRLMTNLFQDTCRYVAEYEALCQSGAAAEAEDARHASLGELAGFIEENLSDSRLSAAFLAERFGYSVSYFSKLFKEMYGSTIYEFINERRMRRAKRLLDTTADTLESIVTEIGYVDTSSFIRKFKKLTGMTPGDYRKRHAGAAAPAGDGSRGKA